jgi:TRAP-type mannitol/chloroaromatic compound transport system permease small subunit
MDNALKFAAVMDSTTRRIGKAAGWLILPLIFVIMFDVVTRKLDFTRLMFSDFTVASGYSVSTILQDLEWHIHGVILLMSFGFGYLANAHVRVDVFRELLPRRTQGRIELVGLLVLAVPALLVLIAYSWTLFHLSWLDWEGSDSLTGIGWRWFIKGFMVIGLTLALLAVVATIVRLVAFLFGSQEHQERALDGLEIFADEHAELDAARKAAEDALKAEFEHVHVRDHEHKGR